MSPFGMYAIIRAPRALVGLQDVRRHHKTMSAPPSGRGAGYSKPYPYKLRGNDEGGQDASDLPSRDRGFAR
jgi:hypothetical protein